MKRPPKNKSILPLPYPLKLPPLPPSPSAQQPLRVRLARIWVYCSAWKVGWLLVVLGTAASALSEASVPALLKPLLDDGFTQGRLPISFTERCRMARVSCTSPALMSTAVPSPSPSAQQPLRTRLAHIWVYFSQWRLGWLLVVLYVSQYLIAYISAKHLMHYLVLADYAVVFQNNCNNMYIFTGLALMIVSQIILMGRELKDDQALTI